MILISLYSEIRFRDAKESFITLFLYILIIFKYPKSHIHCMRCNYKKSSVIRIKNLRINIITILIKYHNCIIYSRKAYNKILVYYSFTKTLFKKLILIKEIQ